MEPNELLAKLNNTMLDSKGKCFSLMDQMYSLAVTPQVAYIQGLMKMTVELKKENDRLKAEIEVLKGKPPRVIKTRKTRQNRSNNIVLFLFNTKITLLVWQY